MGANGAIEKAVDEMTDSYRSQCLWFLRPDFYPRTTEERLRVLGYIEKHGDRDAFQKAARLRQWLSRSSSARSAGS
jgi:hypothetical protein